MIDTEGVKTLHTSGQVVARDLKKNWEMPDFGSSIPPSPPPPSCASFSLALR